MVVFMAMALRGSISFILALLFGFAGLLIPRLVGPGAGSSMATLIWGTAIGSGMAAFLSWLKPEVSYRIIFISLTVAVAGAILGSWLGFWYGEAAYPEGVRNVRFAFASSARSPAVWTFIAGAAIFSTVFGGSYYGFRLWRFNEV